MVPDLIVDVMKAADRQSVLQAHAKLAARTAAPAKVTASKPNMFASIAETFGLGRKPAMPSTDLVADVMAAADPARMQQAEAGLDLHATVAANDRGKLPATGTAQDPAMQKAMQGLQASLLSTMVDAMVPKEQESLYGGGTAGEVWRSFQVNQFADSLASRDVLNLTADASPNAGQGTDAVQRLVQWPYFQSGSITSFADPKA